MSDLPVLREVGDEACLWAEKSTEDVADKLTRLITDKTLAGNLSNLGPTQSAKFSWDKTAKELIERLQA